MNVLSLFDGISCAQIALERSSIPVDNYFASEIDKYAIKVTQHNYPNTIQLGDVANIDATKLPKIDLLVGGSPCQGFSKAGKRLNFQDPKSKLFFEYVRILKECKPKHFLLENVKMKKQHQEIISEYLGCEPIQINSSLVSAQSRMRYYWTNINVQQPSTKNIVLDDILESDIEQVVIDNKYTFIPVDKHDSKNGLVCVGGFVLNNKMWINDGKFLQGHFHQGNRLYSSKGKAPTLNANNGRLGGKTGLYLIDDKIRRLTRVECERLQTVPDNYTSMISNTQAIKALGNGFTVDVISHILNGIKNESYPGNTI